MTLNLTDIYKILADVTERNNTLLKTFAALRFTEEFNDVALGKGAFYRNGTNDNIFYSKAWADDSYNVNKTSIDYPALIAFSNTATVGVAFSPNYTIELYTVNLNEKINKSWEFLMADLDEYLVLVLRQLQDYVYVTSDQVTGWYYESVVSQNISDETWTNATVNGWFKERLKSRNINFTRGYAETPKDLLTVGVVLQIQGCIL